VFETRRSPIPASKRAPAELLLVLAGLLQLPAREALRVHLPGALAGAHQLPASVLCRIVEADPALLPLLAGAAARLFLGCWGGVCVCVCVGVCGCVSVAAWWQSRGEHRVPVLPLLLVLVLLLLEAAAVCL